MNTWKKLLIAGVLILLYFVGRKFSLPQLLCLVPYGIAGYLLADVVTPYLYEGENPNKKKAVRRIAFLVIFIILLGYAGKIALILPGILR